MTGHRPAVRVVLCGTLRGKNRCIVRSSCACGGRYRCRRDKRILCRAIPHTPMCCASVLLEPQLPHSCTRDVQTCAASPHGESAASRPEGLGSPRRPRAQCSQCGLRARTCRRRRGTSGRQISRLRRPTCRRPPGRRPPPVVGPLPCSRNVVNEGMMHDGGRERTGRMATTAVARNVLVCGRNVRRRTGNS
jgi:hypothetical protein